MNDPVRTDAHPEPPPVARPEDQLQLAVEETSAGRLTVRVTGDLDLLTATVLRERLWPKLRAPNRVVVLDLTPVGFLGSAGLSELVAANDTATRNGVQLLVVAATRVVLRPLEITGLRTLFAVYESLDEAERAADQV
ncbi:MAG: STAS domain-containing protein [Labedaea sp.]